MAGAVRRVALVGPDLLVANVAWAEAGWAAPAGLVAVLSETAAPGDVYDPVAGAFSAPPGRAEARRREVAAEVQARRNAIMAAGCPYAGKRIEVDDASRANLGAVVVTALVAANGMAPWPDALKLGWITLENERIPLPGPADAVSLGLSVLGWYSGLIQFARDLKDAVLAADDPRAAADAADWGPWTGA